MIPLGPFGVKNREGQETSSQQVAGWVSSERVEGQRGRGYRAVPLTCIMTRIASSVTSTSLDAAAVADLQPGRHAGDSDDIFVGFSRIGHLGCRVSPSGPSIDEAAGIFAVWSTYRLAPLSI